MAAIPAFSVRNAMAGCGLLDDPNVPGQLFNGHTVAQRVAFDVFNDDFRMCMDKSFKELDTDFKSCSDLTKAHGRLRCGHATSIDRV